MLLRATIFSHIQQSKWVVVLATLGGLLVLLARKPRHRFPRGPKRIPLFGNAFNFPKNRWYEAFSQWKADYGMFNSFRHLILATTRSDCEHFFTILIPAHHRTIRVCQYSWDPDVHFEHTRICRRLDEQARR